MAGEVGGDVGGRARLRRGRCDNENEGAQARDKGFQERTSASGTWPTARAAVGPNAESPALAVRVRSCEATGEHKDPRDRLPNLHRRVTSVYGSNNAKRPSRGVSEAAGQGLEPQLPEPESGVLPLDDPAGRRADCSRPGGSDLEPVLRDEALLGIGVDVRDHLDVRLEPRPSQLRPQQPVDLEEA